jgi:SAM-dependent MidA family methyltransferase
MPFERFMRLALYDPDGGFFGAGPLRSTKAGDFLTSPEVSPWFGRTLARYIGQRLVGLSAPRVLIEVGAGSGSLLEPLLASVAPAPQRTVAIDASPAARSVLSAAGYEALGDLRDLTGPLRGVIVANELLDNLPMRLAARVGSRWEERWIGVEGTALGLVAAPVRKETADWLDRYAGPVTDGGLVEVQLAAHDWLLRALALLESGSIVIIDYGATAEELAPRRAIGTLRTYRAHHLGPDPLLEPGATDITADVNFTALLGAARDAGVSAVLHRQDDFLVGLGLRDRLAELRDKELELARGDDALARLQVRSEIKDAETLLHPRGLGDFRVLVLEK